MFPSAEQKELLAREVLGKVRNAPQIDYKVHRFDLTGRLAVESTRRPGPLWKID